MKIAFVVQRYGLEVNGGAELLCRQMAEHLSKHCNVEVITTCAIDYMTWRNEYKEGTDVVNGINVHRFPVDKPRNVEIFNRMSEKIFYDQPHTKEDELKWMELQGPYSQRLFDYINSHKDDYEYFFFFTYLYCTTFFGLPLVKDKAILVPTAHDEPPIYLEIFKEIFSAPQSIVYNTDEEKAFVNRLFNNMHIYSEVAGAGIDFPINTDSNRFIKKYDIHDDFIIYIGRIDESKGCKQLFEYFLRYKSQQNSNLKLVLLGKQIMKVPNNKDIIPIGFVTDEDKYNGIMASKLMVTPSKYESLSLVTLEAWICKRPVLVNGGSTVLKGHCIKSNAGLWYEDYDEFKESLDILLASDNLREKMGINGTAYVENNYNWKIIEQKYIKIIEQ